MIEVWRLRAMTIIDKIKDTILKFIGGAYDPLQFSYDLPNLIVDNYDELKRYDEKLAKRLDDIFPEVCAEYERGDDPEPFRKKVREEYERIFKQKAH
nr:MAG TPA: hypothetical protein [Caudoviricetes sp.]